MPWVHQAKLPHECKLPANDTHNSVGGSMWVCDECGQWWRLKYWYTDMFGTNPVWSKVSRIRRWFTAGR